MNYVKKLLLVVSLLEVINPVYFSIQIAWPFTLSRWAFVFLGLLSIPERSKFRMEAVFFLLVPFGYFISSFAASDFLTNLSTSLGILLLSLSSIGVAEFISSQFFLKVRTFYFLFVIGVFYWCFYVFKLFYNGEVGLTHNFNSSFNSIETVNHHVFGTVLSVGGMFSLIYWNSNGLEKGRIRISSIVFFALILSAIVLSQSRANLIAFLFGTIFYLSWWYIKFKKSIFPLIIMIGFFAIINFDSETMENSISKRYALDSDYQLESNQSRFELYRTFFSSIWDFIIVGRGPKDGYLRIYEKGYAQDFLMHNNFLTILIMGGFVSFIGYVSFVTRFTIDFWRFIKLNEPRIKNKSISAYAFSSAVLLVCMFFYEIGGLIFYLQGAMMLAFLNQFLKYRQSPK